jgi:anaerobic selenocysteine-containing dehydrogenase
MMASEEAWLLGKAIREIDPQAVLILGPVPTSGQDDVFKNPANGKQTFVIKAEKVPNAAGIRRVIAMLGGPSATFDEAVTKDRADLKKLKGGWIVGGYLSNWIPTNLPDLFKTGYRVVQDILPNALTDRADIVLPAAAWAEKAGSWENYQGRTQAFGAAVAPPEGARREGDVYYWLLGRPGLYHADVVRQEMGEPFAGITLPAEGEEEPAPEFVEL